MAPPLGPSSVVHPPQLMMSVFWVRVPIRLPTTHIFLAINLFCCLGDIAWRRACRGKPAGGSFGRRRELLVALFW